MTSRTPKRPIPVVALLSDFGISDHYVAAMKSVMLSHDPGIRFIDITHQIEPGNIRAGGFSLWAVQEDLPKGSLSVCVVDPGVGTNREILFAEVDGRMFLAPDNGLLDLILAACRHAQLYSMDGTKVSDASTTNISSTFHGRDIFAPLAARLVTGTPSTSLGRKKKFIRPTEWRVLNMRSGVPPAVMSVDSFGNIVTNIVAENMASMKRDIRAVSVGKVMISVAAGTFAEGPENTPCLVAGSSGLVEVVIRNGSAAEVLRVNDRTSIRVVWSEDAAAS